MFKLKINLDRHGPASYPNICLLPGPHCFSFPSTFKTQFSCHTQKIAKTQRFNVENKNLIKQTKTNK
jgi:hypothetical protein